MPTPEFSTMIRERGFKGTICSGYDAVTQLIVANSPWPQCYLLTRVLTEMRVWSLNTWLMCRGYGTIESYCWWDTCDLVDLLPYLLYFMNNNNMLKESQNHSFLHLHISFIISFNQIQVNFLGKTIWTEPYKSHISIWSIFDTNKLRANSHIYHRNTFVTD